MFDHKKDIHSILESGFTDRDYYTVLADFFEVSAISIRNSVHLGKTREVYEKRYEQIISKYSRVQFEALAIALGMLVTDIQQSVDDGSLCDWCGEIYMDSNTSNGRMGQFFTPYNVSRMIAQVSLKQEEIDAKLNLNPNAVFTIYEPTCGGGGLIIAAVEKLIQLRVNYSYNVFVDCGDIDARCVHMTYIALSLLGVPAVVRKGDALSLQYTEAWFTPAYVFNCAHFNKEIGDGSYPYTPVVVKPIAQPKSIPIQIAKAEVLQSPNVDKHGQYVLNLF